MSLVNQKVTFIYKNAEVTGTILEKYSGLKKVDQQTRMGTVVHFLCIDFYMIKLEDETVHIPVKSMNPLAIK